MTIDRGERAPTVRAGTRAAYPIDALVFTVPFAPYDAGPPTGPAVLKAHAEAAGLSVRTVDLNARYLRRFASGDRAAGGLIGDQAKDRVRTDAAREHFRAAMDLVAESTLPAPSCVDPRLGLNCTFDELDAQVRRLEADGWWRGFVEDELNELPQPRVVGLSIMGPSQVVLARLVARAVRRRWPSVAVVGGGSHVTLLAEAIARDARYGRDFDVYLPGHSEQVFVDLLRGRAKAGVLRAGEGSFRPAPAVPSELRLPPVFEEAELALYDHRRLVLPVQFARGCSYGRCSMCTYPAVEARERIAMAAMARRFLPALARYRVPRLSVKDSLLEVPRLGVLGDAMSRHAPEMRWSITTKVVRALARADIAGLYEAGLRTVELGVETIHPDIQRVVDKRHSLQLVEDVVQALIEAGISVVANLIYGFPGEMQEQAEAQLAWWLTQKARWPERFFGSHNMLEVNRGAPLAAQPARYGVVLGEVAPWAFSYAWSAPAWRPGFAARLNRCTREPIQAHARCAPSHSPSQETRT